MVDAKSGFMESMNLGQQHLLNVTYKTGLEGWEQGIPCHMDSFPDKTLMPEMFSCAVPHPQCSSLSGTAERNFSEADGKY